MLVCSLFQGRHLLPEQADLRGTRLMGCLYSWLSVWVSFLGTGLSLQQKIPVDPVLEADAATGPLWALRAAGPASRACWQWAPGHNACYGRWVLWMVAYVRWLPVWQGLKRTAKEELS